jgi:hypothetical protein
VGNDGRLSNARTPTTHASTHGEGQSDPITITQTQVTNLTTALAAKVANTTTITAGTGLTGGGDLSANRSFAVDFGATSTTATVGNDARFSFTAAGSGATTRTLQNKLRDVISVKDFGAVGNGVADDTAALQLALNAGAGKCVYLPPGTYKTLLPLTISANTTVQADDRQAVIYVQPLNDPTPLGTSGPSTCNNGFIINGDGVVIDGLWIRGSNEARYRVAPYDTTQRAEYAAGIRSTNKQNIVITNCTFQEFANGVFFTGGNNYKITDNFFFGGRQMGAANWVANAHDILMNGAGGLDPNKGFRGIISRNHCLGNVDDAILVAAEAGDLDIVITENICEPFQTDGIGALDNTLAPTLPAYPLIGGKVNPEDPVLNNAACNKTRYGITVSYNGGWPSRVVVSNNIVRNNAHNGIYANSSVQSPVAAGSEVIISNNITSKCGFGLLYPSDTSLKGGIWVNSNGGKTVSGNLILDCAGYGITVVGPADDVANDFATPVITGNTILRTVRDPAIPPIYSGGLLDNPSGHGIGLFGTTVHSVLITSNRIFNSAANAINVICNSDTSGNIQIVGNLISHNGIEGGIFIFASALAADCFVSANKITNKDNATVNNGKNAGIWFQGRVHCTNNSITNFQRGIQSNSSTRVTDIVCANNTLKSMVFGISGNGAGPWLVSDNVFTSISNNLCHNGPWQGTMMRSTNASTADKVDIIQITATAIPTTGTWVVGDYIKNSNPTTSPAAPKGWYCITAGTGAGATWHSEGNL